ncbi:MAG: hypothetical protein EA425_01200 [Puniceicoccaceae bacterium]|nr:MAG: hypothetical protein EA425_01200 [Puniceicoccaceae bacterium]
MDKTKLLDALLASLKAELAGAVAASKDAAAYATNEESRAESQWDTQGIEASYLAAGQASQAGQWAHAIEVLEQARNELVGERIAVLPGALVRCRLGGGVETFFLAPAAGGHVLEIDGEEITVISPHSPIAERMMNRSPEETFPLPSGATGLVLEVH